MSIRIVSGLERKHRALAEELRGHFADLATSRDAIQSLRDLEPEIQRLRTAIEGLEVSLKTFAPDWSASQSYKRPRTKRSPFEKGQLRSLLMRILREDDKARTQAELLEEIIRRHVSQPLDHKDRANLQVGLRSQLKRDWEKGLIERTENPERWRLIRKSEHASRIAASSTAASAA